MKKITITWIVVAFILAIALLLFGIKITQKKSPYKALENDIIEAMKIYYGQDENLTKLPKPKNISKITISDLEAYGIDLNTTIDNDSCDGFGIVYGENFGYTYKAYIKCKNYTTTNYKKY